jgi:hypothetical protein
MICKFCSLSGFNQSFLDINVCLRERARMVPVLVLEYGQWRACINAPCTMELMWKILIRFLNTDYLTEKIIMHSLLGTSSFWYAVSFSNFDFFFLGRDYLYTTRIKIKSLKVKLRGRLFFFKFHLFFFSCSFVFSFLSCVLENKVIFCPILVLDWWSTLLKKFCTKLVSSAK